MTIEAQDFYDNDSKMTFTCYEPEGHSSVMGIDLKTGQVTNFSKAPGTYNEVEGIFPDGLYTAVEADRQCEQLGGPRGAGNIDIWKLRLDGTGKDFTRLTNFNDYEGGKASNPVLSTDGRFMAFQSAKTTDPAGVGYGILIYWFKTSSACSQPKAFGQQLRDCHLLRAGLPAKKNQSVRAKLKMTWRQAPHGAQGPSRSVATATALILMPDPSAATAAKIALRSAQMVRP